MAIVLLALSVAFAAFCVWLVVRIINRRERWAKWTLAGALIVGCLVAFFERNWALRQIRKQVMQEYEQQRQSRMNPPAPNPDAPPASD
jgi:type VI protein secretion system component VasK